MPSLTDAVAVRKTYDQLFSPLNVLVVDDMPVIRRMLRQMLQHLGVQGDIQEAGDGQEAWEILQERPFDLVVCDINMPRMSGIDLLRHLRASPHYQTTPFLMISGEVSEDIVAASAESEVDGYLLKPFKIDSLEGRLRAIILHRYQPSPIIPRGALAASANTCLPLDAPKWRKPLWLLAWTRSPKSSSSEPLTLPLTMYTFTTV